MVTAPSSGAEVIPFLKTYVNLPGAVAFTVLYSKLCNAAEQVCVIVYCRFVSFNIFFSSGRHAVRNQQRGGGGGGVEGDGSECLD